MAPAIPAIFAAVAALGSGYMQARASRKASHAQADAAAASAAAAKKSMVSIPTGPTAAEVEAQKKAAEEKAAKQAAEKRAADLEASMKAETEAAGTTRRRSLAGLAATVRTSAAGLTGKATVEKKSLLGQGGAY